MRDFAAWCSYTLTLALLASTTLAFGGCGSDDASPDGGVFNGSGSMSATIDGSRWEAGASIAGVPAGFAQAVSASRRDWMAGETLQINGLRTDGATSGDGIVLYVYSESGFPIGTYPVSESGLDGTSGAQVTLPDQTYYNAVTGSLAITDITDTSVSGTFVFNASDNGRTVVVTAGKFASSVMQF